MHISLTEVQLYQATTDKTKGKKWMTTNSLIDFNIQIK